MKNTNENDLKSDTIVDMNTKKTNGNVNDFLVNRSFVKINFSEYKRRPDKYAEEQREDKYERLEDDREWERRRNRDL